MKNFKFIDLFAGVWGFHLAFHNAWWTCVWSCEIDKNARITYEYNFKNYNPDLFEGWDFFEDITQINGDEIKDHDILCAWFPCQAFSIAGHRKWFSDQRGNLFFDVARIIEKKQPKVVFLENVKNLVSHDDGKTFQAILDTLQNLWYYVEYDVLNTYEYWNIPQNRERIYIVAFKDEAVKNEFSFPWKQDLNIEIKDLLEKNVDKTFYYDEKPLYDRIKNDVTKENTAYQWRI